MDGIQIAGARPKSKKAVKEAITHAPASVFVEETSMFGGRGLVTLDQALDANATIYFVGPNPHTDRRFYGSIKRGPQGYIVK